MIPDQQTDTARSPIKMLCQLTLQLLARIDGIGPLAVRLIIGFAFFLDGKSKLGNLENVARFFAKIHIMHPDTDALLVSVIELVAGPLLVIGLGTRIAAALLAFIMLGALVHAIVPQSKSVLDLFSSIELTYLAIFVWLIVSSGGPISVDHLIARRATRRGRSIAPASAAAGSCS